MVRLIIILTFALIVQSGNAVAQSSASPSPTPATRRPALDQFGLSMGVFANSAKPAPTENEPPVTKVEYVDEHIFETINVIIEKSEFLESELSRVLSNSVDISPSSRFRKYFEHHIEGLMEGSITQRTGRFGGEGIKRGEVTKLLEQNERTVFEILVVLDAGTAEYAQFNRELNGVSERYGVPLLENSVTGMRLNKPALLKAMMARINANYARVRKQIALKK